MQRNQLIQEIAIVGGGPVGNLSAVLAGMLGVKCTVYQKRDSYSREINLKIHKDFFQQTGKMFNRIMRGERKFFETLNNTINEKNGKILLKDLEERLRQEAISLGVQYIKRQIKTFGQVQNLHKFNNPIILDCTGRNSPLRVGFFGSDEDNMKIYNLHHALHINFKAIVPRKFDFSLLYPVIKNGDNLKLGQIIVSKAKENQSSQYHHVTVPLFISDELSDIIDQKYPTINRHPLKPFSIKPEQSNIAEQVSEVIYSLFCALVMEGWEIEWSGVVLKKINITCGYAIKRSNIKYICLGDSAAHFAYFKSLNFGLSHAYELMKTLAGYHGLKYSLNPLQEKAIVNRCWKKNPLLWPIKAKQGPSAAQYFVTTQQVKILAPYLYDIRNDSTTRIDLIPAISQQKIHEKFELYANEMKQKSWDYHLEKFEKVRQRDIDNEILSNRSKKTGTELVSYFIWMNSLSPIKFTETVSFFTNGYYLEKRDFDYFSKTLEEIKMSTLDWKKFCVTIRQKISNLLEQKKDLDEQFRQFFNLVLSLCSIEDFDPNQFSSKMKNVKIESKKNKNKRSILLAKGIEIIAYIIRKQHAQAQHIGKQARLDLKQI